MRAVGSNLVFAQIRLDGVSEGTGGAVEIAVLCEDSDIRPQQLAADATCGLVAQQETIAIIVIKTR